MHFFQNIFVSILVSVGSLFSGTDSYKIEKLDDKAQIVESTVRVSSDEGYDKNPQVLIDASSSQDFVVTASTSAEPVLENKPVPLFKVNPVVVISNKEKPTILITKSPAPTKKVTLSSMVSEKKEASKETSKGKGEAIIGKEVSSPYSSFIAPPQGPSSQNTSTLSTEKAGDVTIHEDNEGVDTKDDKKDEGAEAELSIVPSEDQLLACEDKDEGSICNAEDSKNTLIVGTCQVVSEFFACTPQ